MGVTLSQYNTYSSAKKARFQKEARQKLAEVHQTDADGYTELTEKSVKTASDDAEQAEIDAREDEENS